METYNTFWDILENIGIEIPAIQRDYAQGRQEGKIPVIRKKFISKLIDSLMENKPIRLDFVYGKIYGQKTQEELRKNKKAVEELLNSIKNYADSIDLVVSDIKLNNKSNESGETVYLIPLDGQQRLTALFLIHWYVAKRLDKGDGFKNELNTLKRFRYKTRKSTESFINLLCDSSIELDFNSEIISKEIKNLGEYSNTWSNDPTVESMLVVLDEIHNCFKNKKLNQEIWKQLTEDKVLYFDFLNLKDFDLSDDLYVKMNARGKALTEFENFKAWLIGKITNEKWIDSETWKNYSNKIDVDWNDLFWDSKNDEVYEVDRAFFTYFKIMFLIDVVIKSTIADKKNSFSEKYRDLINETMSGKEDFNFEEFFDSGVFKNNIKKYFNFLNYCHNNKDVLEEFNEFRNFIFNSKGKIEWTTLIKNYITIAYINSNIESEFDKDKFDTYYRVLINLYNNQTFDSAIAYKTVLGNIKSLNEKLLNNNNIKECLKNLQRESNAFTKEQLEEEILKLELISNNKDWLDRFKKAEFHEYFKGKINFLINLSEKDSSKFEEYYNKIAPLFESKILNTKEFLFQRVLLTFGNYFVDKGGGKVTFYKNDNSTYRSRNENWNNFLSSEKLNILKSLVDSEVYNKDTVNDSLKKIVDNWIVKNPKDKFENKKLEELDYTHFYIYHPDLFKYGSERLIQLSANGKYAYQLNSTRTSGYFSDNILSYIKATHFKDNNSVAYWKTKGWENDPSLVVNDVNKIVIVTVPSQNKFQVYLNDKEEQSLNSINELIVYIKRELEKL